VTEFLARIGEILADADQERPPSHAWDRLLPEIAERAAQGGPYTAALWIADDDTGCAHTLWTLLTENGPVRDPPCAVSIAADSSETAALHAVCAAARQQWAPAAPPDQSHCLILPLIFTDRKQEPPNRYRLGLISLLVRQNSDDAGLQTAVRMAAAWLRLNREARVMRALTDLQHRRQQVDTVDDLATMLCGILADHANARKSCALYIPSGDRLVRRDDFKGGCSGVAPREFAADCAIAGWHFAGDAAESEFETALLRFGSDGLQRGQHALLPDLILRDLIGCDRSEHPVSVLLCRIRDRRVGYAPQAPIALLVMACEPRVSRDHPSIGGAFTRTHRRTLEQSLDYFRNSYALLLQRERMGTIQQRVEEIASRTIDVMNEAHDMAHLSAFAMLAIEAVPAVINAVAIEWKSSGEIRYHPASLDKAGSEHQAQSPNWLPTIPADWRNGKFCEVRRDEGICVLVPVGASSGGPQRQILALHLRSHALSIVERHLVEQIGAECRAELNRHLHKPQWELQLAEVRHNLRSVIQSVVGKAAKVGDLYQVVHEASPPADEVKERLITRAQYRKAINQLNLASNQLLTLTENIRTLVGSGPRIDLQLAPVDLPAEIKAIIAMFREEIERRGLQCVLSIENEAVLGHVSADRQWIHVLLFNLIENAVKYSSRDGRIDVRLWAQWPFWRLEVVNNGKYIPPEHRRQIFQPYYRVPSEKGEQGMPGTGLGLWSVQRIVELHQMAGVRLTGGKSIEVDSQRNESHGLRARNYFRIAIPLHVKGAA